ncbi:ligand-binding sensor domain-containing protein [Pseudothauera lacus]|uniref:Uncharacterized protein n=1 Tax=Pseudothauera lacus TaxID=2136175 RepID=A0A2T4IGD3_9RHOO|nr:hypothetical protein [Pseudothauera lacus]PTD96834.1 hypothetical protein C8261_08485 [Pseudothauera lacus]
MKTDEGRRTGRHQTRIARTAYGWLALLVALPFILIGAYYALAGFGMAPFPGTARGPMAVLGWTGVAFLASGLLLAAHALRGLWAGRQAARLRSRYADQPWLADYPWDTSGVTDDAGRRLVEALAGTLAMGALLVPFNWWAFFSDEGVLTVRLITAFFDVMLVLAAGTCLYGLARYLKYGNARLSFAQFPFLPGRPLRVGLAPNRCARLRLTLRYVTEQFVSTGSGSTRQTTHKATALVVREWTMAPDLRAAQAEIEFEIPAEPGRYTRLTAAPDVHYWELVVEASEPGIDFHAAFALPVYRCDAAQVSAPLRRGAVPRARFLAPYAFELGLPVALLVGLGALWWVAPQPVEQAAEALRGQVRGLHVQHLLTPTKVIDRDAMALQVQADGVVWALGKYALVRIEGDELRTVLDPQIYRARFEGRADAMSTFLVGDGDELWLGTWYGELLYHRAGQWVRLSAREAPLGRRIEALLIHAGELLVGGGDGLWRYRTDGGLTQVAELGTSQVSALVDDGAGGVFAAGKDGVWRLRDGRWQRWWQGEQARGGIGALHRTEDGGLLLGSNVGLLVLDETGRLLRHELQGERVRAIARVADRVWVAGWDGGLYAWEQGRWLVLDERGGLPRNTLSAIAGDGAGTLWIAVYGAGLSRASAAALLAAMR